MKHVPKQSHFVRLTKNLVTLLLIVIVLSFFHFYSPKIENEESNFGNQKLKSEHPISYKKQELHKKINPNNATFEELIEIGFTKKQASNCLNYIKKGHQFKNTKDILLLYSMTYDDYIKIEPYITIPNILESKNNNYKLESALVDKPQTKTKQHIQIEINSCDTTDLIKIPGIGSFRAKKIIEYRKKLGGFISMKQLQSIYTFDSTLVAQISDFIQIDSSKIEKININTATFKEINAHPLINYYKQKIFVIIGKSLGI